MPKNQTMPRINMDNDVEIMLYILLDMANKVEFDGRQFAALFTSRNVLNHPLGVYFTDDGGTTMNSNGNRILTHSVDAGLLVDIGSKRAHGGTGKNGGAINVYTFGNYWRKWSKGTVNLGEVLTDMHDKYKWWTNWRNKITLKEVYDSVAPKEVAV